MALQVKEKVITKTTIEDVRGLSHAEIIGLITADIMNAKHSTIRDYEFIDENEHVNYILEKIVTDYIVACDPETKSITITLGKDSRLMGDEVYQIKIYPNYEKGIIIYYYYNPLYGLTSCDVTHWNIDECIEILNIDWEEN